MYHTFSELKQNKFSANHCGMPYFLSLFIVATSFWHNLTLIATSLTFAERDGDELEGMLVRKHEWENTTKKASNR